MKVHFLFSPLRSDDLLRLYPMFDLHIRPPGVNGLGALIVSWDGGYVEFG
jgi:hypothetical protein